MNRTRAGLMIAITTLALAACGDEAAISVPLGSASMPAQITRVNVNDFGQEAIGGASSNGSPSDNGRFVVFESNATNLVPIDTNGTRDVFLHDVVLKTTIRASIHTSGAQSASPSDQSGVSGQGRFVVFHAFGDDLVAGDVNAAEDVLMRDTYTNTTTRVSLDNGGVPAGGGLHSYDPSISADGRFVSFTSNASFDGNGTAWPDVFVRDLKNGVTIQASRDNAGTDANNTTGFARLADDGRHVVIHIQSATNLPAPDANGARDVSVKNFVTGQIVHASVDSAGVLGNFNSDEPEISANGRFVVFSSQATTLVPGDTNGFADIFLRDMAAGTTERVSLTDLGFESNNGSFRPSVSGNGRYVVFESNATNLIAAGDANGAATDIYVRDRWTGATARVNVNAAGIQDGASNAVGGRISSDGRYITFESASNILVPNDFNAQPDIFLTPNPLFP